MKNMPTLFADMNNVINGVLAAQPPTPRKAKRTRKDANTILGADLEELRELHDQMQSEHIEHLVGLGTLIRTYQDELHLKREQVADLKEEIATAKEIAGALERQTIEYIRKELSEAHTKANKESFLAEPNSDAAILAGIKEAELVSQLHILDMFEDLRSNIKLQAEVLNGEKPDQVYRDNLCHLSEVTMGLAYNLYEDGYQLKQQLERRKDPEAYDALWEKRARSESDMADYYEDKTEWRRWLGTEEGQVYLAEEQAKGALNPSPVSAYVPRGFDDHDADSDWDDELPF